MSAAAMPAPRSVLDWARYYAARGWSVVPVRPGEKIPAVPWAEYQRRRASDAELHSWFADGSMGIGIVTGAISGIFVADFDGAAGAALRERLDAHLPGPVSLTGGGGAHVILRHPGVRIPTRKGIAPGLDIRGDGGFIVAPPSRHASGNPYAWDVDAHPDDIAVHDAPGWFIERITADAPPGPGHAAEVTRSAGSLGLDIGQITDGRETYMRNTILAVCRELRDQLGRLPTPQELEDAAWPQYAARVDFSRPGRGRDEFRAKCAYTLRRAEAGSVRGLDAGGGPFGDEKPTGGSDAPVATFPATAFDPGELAGLAPREWVYGHFLIARFLSVLGAPGGTGKTAYAIAVGLSVCLDNPLLGEKVHKPGNAWIYNLEDPRDELLRRVYAACLAHKINPQALVGRLFLDSGRDRPLVVAERTKDGQIVALPVVEPLVAELRARGVRLLIVDPFVKSHRLEENRNEQIDFAATLWNRVASEANCAVLLVHHFRKGAAPGEADAFRGASALVDASRAAVALSVMGEQEADRLGVNPDERRFYVRADNAKLNLAPPPRDAVWLNLESVDLPNGDKVQAVKRWQPPSPWGNLPMNLAVQVLDKIAAGLPNGDRWGSRKSAGDKWAGAVLVEMAATTDGQAAEILRAWKENGVITDGQYKNAKGDLRWGYTVDQDKVAEMRQASRPVHD